MIFKRKKEKELSVGDRCVLDPYVKEKLYEESSYNSSIIKLCDKLNYIQLTPRILRRNKHLRIMLHDCEILYISKSSIFDGLFEVIPLSIRKDSEDAVGLRGFIKNSPKPFLVSKKSLKRASATDIHNHNIYRTSAVSFISDLIRRKYDKSFLWAYS